MLRLRTTRPLGRAFTRLNGTVAPTEAASTPEAPSPPPPAASASKEAATPAAPKTADTKATDTTTTTAATSTAEATGEADADAEATDKPTTRGRRGPRPHRRSLAALGKTAGWNRPLAPGVLPAYDEALKLLRADSRTLKTELEGVQKKLEGLNGKEGEALRKKANILEVQSEINLPDVRWKARNGQGDMSKAVYRHLAEQKWRKDGDLDLLMERVHQMNVVPDVLQSLHPSFALRVAFPQWNVAAKHMTWQHVDPGVFLEPQDTIRTPRLYATVFHPEPRLYTLLMVDPDVPDSETQSFSTYVHWLQPNISLSATTAEVPLPPIEAQHTPYVAPHPHKGTKYHRYVLLLLPQPQVNGENKPIDIPTLLPSQRQQFDVRAFCAHYGLEGSKGGAAHMWREVWSEDVSRMYEEGPKKASVTLLEGPEPKYGRPRKQDPYQEVKESSRYIMSQ